MTRSNWEVEDGAELSLVNNTRLRMLDAPGKVANRVKNFPLRLAQVFLRCVALGHIELVFAKVLLLSLLGIQTAAVGGFIAQLRPALWARNGLPLFCAVVAGKRGNVPRAAMGVLKPRINGGIGPISVTASVGRTGLSWRRTSSSAALKVTSIPLTDAEL